MAADQGVFSFRLYIAGWTGRSATAVTNLRALCNNHLAGQYELEIVDAFERPDLAEQQGILVTPTVVRLAPPPQLRVIGDLSDRWRVAAALGIPSASDGGEEGDSDG